MLIEEGEKCVYVLSRVPCISCPISLEWVPTSTLTFLITHRFSLSLFFFYPYSHLQGIKVNSVPCSQAINIVWGFHSVLSLE